MKSSIAVAAVAALGKLLLQVRQKRMLAAAPECKPLCRVREGRGIRGEIVEPQILGDQAEVDHGRVELLDVGREVARKVSDQQSRVDVLCTDGGLAGGHQSWLHQEAR